MCSGAGKAHYESYNSDWRGERERVFVSEYWIFSNSAANKTYKPTKTV